MFTKEFVGNLVQTTGISTFIMNEFTFLFGTSKWFEDEYFRVYLRNTFKYLPVVRDDLDSKYKKTSVITIASIFIPEEFQRQGLGGNLISSISESHNKDLSLVECVHNIHLANWLKKNYWVLLDEVNSTYYKPNLHKV